MAKIFIKKISLLSLLALIILCSLVYRDQLNNSGNTAQFTRKYNHASLKPFAKISLSFNAGEILDVISNDTLIINSPDGKKLYWLDLKQNSTIEYAPPNIKGQYDRITMAGYHNNTLMVMNGNGRTLLRTTSFPFKTGENTIDTFGYTIIKGLPVSDHRWVIKKMLQDNSSCRLVSYNELTRNQEGSAIGKNDQDCLMTDGSLAFDGKNGVYFINLYNSSVTRYDTSMHRIYETNTIDETRTRPLVHYDALRKRNNFIAPHRIINYCTAADTNNLFVLSAVQAANDLQSTFGRHTPLDVYDAATGAYQNSYHLEDISINSVKGIRLSQDILFVVTDRSLYLYNHKNMLYAQQ